MVRFWICVCFVFLMDARLKEFMGLLSIYRLNLFSFSFVFFSCCCPWEVSLDIRVQHSCCPVCSAHQPWMLTLVNRFASGRAPTGCWSCWLGCWAGGEAGQPGPFFLPLIPGCHSALTINIYTELASGGPRWDQDPAVLATDCHGDVVITTEDLWTERWQYREGKFYYCHFRDGAWRPWDTGLSWATWETVAEMNTVSQCSYCRCLVPKCGWLLPTRR